MIFTTMCVQFDGESSVQVKAAWNKPARITMIRKNKKLNNEQMHGKGSK
jgi:hypothetical protein